MAPDLLLLIYFGISSVLIALTLRYTYTLCLFARPFPLRVCARGRITRWQRDLSVPLLFVPLPKNSRTPLRFASCTQMAGHSILPLLLSYLPFYCFLFRKVLATFLRKSCAFPLYAVQRYSILYNYANKFRIKPEMVKNCNRFSLDEAMNLYHRTPCQWCCTESASEDKQYDNWGD